MWWYETTKSHLLSLSWFWGFIGLRSSFSMSFMRLQSDEQLGVESSQRLPQAPLRLMMGWWWKSQTAGDWNSWGSMDLPPPSLWYFNMVFPYSGIVQLDFFHGDKSLPRVSVPRETSRHRVVLFSLILKVSIISIVLFISTFDSLKCS